MSKCLHILYINREERKNSVPTIVCRMCSQKFYADREKEHSQYCIEKINKTKELP